MRNILLVAVSIFIRISAYGQEFVVGQIITHNLDTITCSVLKLKKHKADEASNYTQIQILDSINQLVKTFYPAEINGFIKDGISYRSLNVNGRMIFIRQLVAGSASLYYDNGNGDKGGPHYLFKRESESEFQILNENTQKFTKTMGVNTNNSTKSSSSLIVNRDYFSEYFKDCPLLVTKIKSEFYTVADMKDIFNDYNQFCSNK